MSDRDDTRDNHENTRESGSMFDPRAAGYPKGWHTHPRGANGPIGDPDSRSTSVMDASATRPPPLAPHAVCVALLAVRVRARAWMDGWLTHSASSDCIVSFVRSRGFRSTDARASRSCARTVETGTVLVVQQRGKFAFFANEGCEFVNPCLCQAVAGAVSTGVQSLDVSVETKTKDNVFVMIVVSVRVSSIRSSFVSRLGHSRARSFDFSSTDGCSFLFFFARAAEIQSPSPRSFPSPSRR